jgi:hypothetical protein
LSGTAIITVILCSRLFEKEPEIIMTQLDAARMFGLVFSKLLLFYVTRIVLKFKTVSNVRFSELTPLLILPVMTAIILNLLAHILIYNSNVQSYVLISGGCVLSINIITYYLFYQMNKNANLKLEHYMLQQQYDNERSNLENAKLIYDDTGALLHDINEHFALIKNYAEYGKNEKIINYIKELDSNEIPKILRNIKTEDEVLNIVINSKLAVCKKEKIYVDLSVFGNIANKISDLDKSVLFGNLFNNAIEAVKSADSKSISLKIQRQDDYISIFMSNTVSSPVLNKNPRLFTQKKDKNRHGIGIKSIRKIVEKYNGIIEFFEEGDRFCCDIMLYDNALMS